MERAATLEPREDRAVLFEQFQPKVTAEILAVFRREAIATTYTRDYRIEELSVLGIERVFGHREPGSQQAWKRSKR